MSFHFFSRTTREKDWLWSFERATVDSFDLTLVLSLNFIVLENYYSTILLLVLLGSSSTITLVLLLDYYSILSTMFSLSLEVLVQAKQSTIYNHSIVYSSSNIISSSRNDKNPYFMAERNRVRGFKEICILNFISNII
jgi:hypothetical protein